MNETRVVPVELSTDVHDAMAMAVQAAIAKSNPCAYWTIARAAFDALLSAAPPTDAAQGGDAVLCAIPLKFESSKVYSDGSQEWNENTMGFHISSDPDEPIDTRYRAAWGEGEPEDFATLEAAQAWCQQEADDWIRKVGRITQAQPQAVPGE